MSELIENYLRDHHAGATAGLELAKRVAASNAETPYGPQLRKIADEIDEDMTALETVMSDLGIGASRLKDSALWTAEKFGRLKRNGTWLAYSPLSRLMEIEGLTMAVTGKHSMWEALAEALSEQKTSVDSLEYARRAEDQRKRLEGLRRDAYRDAFGSASEAESASGSATS